MFNKKVNLFFALVIFSIFIFSGCGLQKSADKVVEEYCITLLKNGKIYDKMLDNFNSQNKNKKDITLTSSQIRNLAVACVEKMKKFNIQTKIITSEKAITSDSDEAKVEVTVEYINLDVLGKDNIFQDELQKRVKDVYDIEERKSIAIDTVIDYIPEIPVEGTRSFIVDCDYDKKQKKWVLKYPDTVTNILISTMMQGARL